MRKPRILSIGLDQPINFKVMKYIVIKNYSKIHLSPMRELVEAGLNVAFLF